MAKKVTNHRQLCKSPAAWKSEVDYAHKLSPEELAWLLRFEAEQFHGSYRKSILNSTQTKAANRERYAARNDVLNRPGHLEYLDDITTKE